MFKKTENINVTNYLTKRKGCYENMIIIHFVCGSVTLFQLRGLMSIRGHHLIGHKFICICLHYLIISIYTYFKKIILLSIYYIRTPHFLIF